MHADRHRRIKELQRQDREAGDEVEVEAQEAVVRVLRLAGGALLGCWRVGHRPLRSTGRWGPGDMTLLLAAGVGKGRRTECVMACAMARIFAQVIDSAN